MRKRNIKEAYGWANDYWHDYAQKDEAKKDIIKFIYDNDFLQAAYDYYKDGDKEALNDIIVSYLDSTYVPYKYYKTFEGDRKFGIRNSKTNELLYSSSNSEDIDDWIDNNDTWSDETYDNYLPIVRNAINEIGYYNFN